MILLRAVSKILDNLFGYVQNIGLYLFHCYNKANIKMENVTTLEQIKSKMQVGDYSQVAEILSCSRDAAKMRLKRGNPEALDALQKLIESREAIKKEFQGQPS